MGWGVGVDGECWSSRVARVGGNGWVGGVE